MINNIPKKISSFILVAIIAFILFKIYVAQDKYNLENNQTEWDKNNTREINANDKLLNNSKQTTQINLPYFKSEFKTKDKSKTDFFTKVKLTENEKTEHIWIYILNINNDKSIGLLYNEPTYFKNIKYLDTITFDINKAEDIMIMKNDSILFGGFLQAEMEKN